ncbi:MAG TPA: ribonuclease [Alphaproteobacteria bacterium]|nr:ribonuclease [Alphaproteobacteria bacterium]
MRWPIRSGLRALILLPLLAACGRDADFDHLVLALSWEPAFCAAHGGKPECRALDAGDFAASNLVLHGLWPNAAHGEEPAYCGIGASTRAADEAGQWCDLPATGADRQTQEDLQRLMPGAESCLDRHEWLKHGTCSGLDGDAYFDAAARLTEAFQATELAGLLRQGVGREIPLARLVDAFEQEFGDGAGAALTVTCRRAGGRAYLAEIRLALRPEAIDEPLAAGSLFLQGDAPRGGCPRNVIIDRAGPG